MRKSPELEDAAVKSVAEFMAASARTAPKTRGRDNIEVVVISEAEERQRLISKMEELSSKLNKPSMLRDAGSIKGSGQIVVIGVRSAAAGLDCGFCGYATCKELSGSKGICAYNSIDLGISVGSAVSTAARFNIDNRIMYSIGKAAMELGFLPKEVKQALGIPLSATGKSPFFDRK
jgi:uncharacterized ferredoxin-like protein